MIKIENTDVFGWEAAIRGMRNPKSSWFLSDSKFKEIFDTVNMRDCWRQYFVAGENDMKLMKTLAKAGDDHGKFLRMINVTVDLTAPLYWWKEFDTYKVGTVANSCSTMHKIHAKEFTLDDFSHEHLDNDLVFGLCANDKHQEDDLCVTAKSALEVIVSLLNCYRKEFLKTHEKHWWWQMIQLLPSSYNQKRTVQLNYAVLKNMYFARRHHKLDEWHTLCDWVLELPYFKEICVQEEE